MLNDTQDSYLLMLLTEILMEGPFMQKQDDLKALYASIDFQRINVQ